MSQLLSDQSAPLPTFHLEDQQAPEKASLIRDSIEAFKANIIPGMIIQAVALIVVLSYYFIPSVNQALTALGNYKSQSELHSIVYTLISVQIFCTIIPMIAMAIMGRLGQVAWWKQFIFFLLLFSMKGMEAHYLYAGLDWLVRDLTIPDMFEVMIKTGIDQFGYTLFYAAWFIAAAYRLKDNNFQLKAWWSGLDRKFWTHVVPVTTVSAWTVWIPGTLLIYALPLPLQIPLNNLLSCFFVLVLAIISSRSLKAKALTE